MSPCVQRKRGGKSIRGKWKRRFRLLKGCFGAYSSVTFPLQEAEPERVVEWHKAKRVLNVGEVLHNDDDDNGWSYALMAFVEYCRENGFDLPANDERPWRQLGIAEAKSSIRGGVSMPPDGRSSPAMVADGKEWVIRAVKNPKLFSFTYIVEARILVQRAQGLTGAYRSVRTPTVAPEPGQNSSYFPLIRLVACAVPQSHDEGGFPVVSH